jgi:hypothetical protein
MSSFLATEWVCRVIVKIWTDVTVKLYLKELPHTCMSETQGKDLGKAILFNSQKYISCTHKVKYSCPATTMQAPRRRRGIATNYAPDRSEWSASRLTPKNRHHVPTVGQEASVLV